jgi:hypothetical protein
MRDEIYNGMFRRDPEPDNIAWLILLLGVICIVLFVSLFAAVAAPGDNCDGYETTSCTTEVWILSLEGNDLAEFETKEECEDWAATLDQQSPQFTALECRAEQVARTEL